MISTALASELRAAGLRWDPISGDAFQLAGREFEGDVFTVSDMTIEPHRYATGMVLGFNGTTEWALDSVALDDALWLPREDQLRELLRGAFRSLERRAGSVGDDGAATSTEYVVTIALRDATRTFASDDPAEAYGRALLELIRAAD
ncbi:pilus assembly protein CpaE [Schumannella sp. 10F1B-5-1]|uniref:pilus assembly protein CpaE n=1 Tax=Schumannella sp. 10F1B-5-1 TaxID=2590780 RepID=UPI0011300082|nr:pilus assembly protein CpaE [Schumannella sp. 10F1B-5-1]TPW72966.1 pilus assembly protein CpaE [Schumannella sp. 10F1B-5-1]